MILEVDDLATCQLGQFWSCSVFIPSMFWRCRFFGMINEDLDNQTKYYNFYKKRYTYKIYKICKIYLQLKTILTANIFFKFYSFKFFNIYIQGVPRKMRTFSKAYRNCTSHALKLQFKIQTLIWLKMIYVKQYFYISD